LKQVFSGSKGHHLAQFAIRVRAGQARHGDHAYDEGRPLVPLVRVSRDLRLAAAAHPKTGRRAQCGNAGVLDRVEEAKKIADKLRAHKMTAAFTVMPKVE
jgi:hypothetical protein